ncbi:cell division protein FtsX [Bacteroidia bacterium]|nr:cell division protein FtsX [Bacteroidia bacterium]
MNKKQQLSPTTFINSKITATVSIALVLFLLGLIIFLSLFANNLSNYIKETLSFDIVLQDNTSKAQIQRLEKMLNETPYAKSTTFVSKEEALKELEADLGQNPEEVLGFNPLPDMIVVHLNAHYANIDSLAVIEKQLQRYSNDIKETEYRKETLQVIGENIAKIGFILLVIALILLFISFALINNTIRLMVYAKRFLIHTMQLVGAKKGFIQKPFILSNVLVGIIAAVIAGGLLYWLIHYMATNIPNMEAMYNTRSLLIVFGSILILGVLISTIATYFAVNKYVSADIEDLYKM